MREVIPQTYDRQIGRLRLIAYAPHEGDRVSLIIPNGWNDSVSKVQNSLTVEELHDLRYLINRALVALRRE